MAANLVTEFQRRQTSAETRLVSHTTPDISDMMRDLNAVPETLAMLHRASDSSRLTALLLALLSQS